jgi:8-oxo-dGTP diphosphatase
MPTDLPPGPRVIGIAILVRDGRVLVARRTPGLHLGGCWEFPGGKAREGESARDAAKREAREEVGVEVTSASLCHRAVHRYGDRTLELWFFLVTAFDGEVDGREGQEIRWMQPHELRALELPEANHAVVAHLIDTFRSGSGS